MKVNTQKRKRSTKKSSSHQQKVSEATICRKPIVTAPRHKTPNKAAQKEHNSSLCRILPSHNKKLQLFILIIFLTN